MWTLKTFTFLFLQVCYQKMNTVWSFVVRAFLLALLSSLALPTGSYSAYVLKDGQNDEQYSLLNSKTDENTNNVPNIIDSRLIQVLKKSTEEVRRRVKRPSKYFYVFCITSTNFGCCISNHKMNVFLNS